MDIVTRKPGQGLLTVHIIIVTLLSSILISYILDVIHIFNDFEGNNPFLGLQVAVHLLIMIAGLIIAIANNIKINMILLLIPVLDLFVPLSLAWIVFPSQFEIFGPFEIIEYWSKCLLFENKWNYELIRGRLLWISCLTFPFVKWIIVTRGAIGVMNRDDPTSKN